MSCFECPSSSSVVKSRVLVRIPCEASQCVSEGCIDVTVTVQRRSPTETLVVVDFDQVSWHVVRPQTPAHEGIKHSYMSVTELSGSNLISHLGSLPPEMFAASHGSIQKVGHARDAKPHPVSLILNQLIRSVSPRKVRVVCVVQRLGSKSNEDVRLIFL